MPDATRLVSTAASDAVRNIAEPYDGYHVQLVRSFANVIRVLHTEPGSQTQRREIRSLVVSFAAEVEAKTEGAK